MRKLSTREVQKIGLTVLLRINEICNEIGVSYTLAYGTLLGAVRHGGFIPWDDDIDIWMLRDDYEKFCSYCVNHKSAISPYQLTNSETNVFYPYMISRFSDTSIKVIFDTDNKLNMGIFVDIYPLDCLGRNTMEAHLFLKTAFFLSRIVRNSKQRTFPRSDSRIMTMINLFVYPISRLIGGRRLTHLLSLYSQKKNHIEDMKYLGCPVLTVIPDREFYNKSWFENPTILSFEGYQFPVPSSYDRVLQIRYGDYMQLPPEDKRNPSQHCYTAYEAD